MKISRSLYDEVETLYYRKSRKGGEWECLRFGQAWFNHFDMHKHTPPTDYDATRLNQLYNNTDEGHARAIILTHYTMADN